METGSIRVSDTCLIVDLLMLWMLDIYWCTFCNKTDYILLLLRPI